MAIEYCGTGNAKRLLRSYSRLDETCSEFVIPTSVAELAQMLIDAKANGRKVTLRAGGWSLHDQSLNHDLVISLESLNQLEPVDVAAREVTVGAAATWLDVVQHTLAHQLVPYVVPTGEGITCGGSLASDGISRYSPSYGSESVHVEKLEFLEVGATSPRWIQKPAASDSSPDAKLFRAIIGGFGYLGVVTRITYGLLDVSEVDAPTHLNQPLRVATTLSAHESFYDLLQRMKDIVVDDVQTSLDFDFDNYTPPAKPDRVRNPSIYAVAFPHKGNGRGAVFRSHYSRKEQGKAYIIYQPRAKWRKWITWLLASSTLKKVINDIVWWTMKRNAKSGETFSNDVLDYMFFMQGQVIGKDWIEDLPNKLLPVIQQTFVVHHEVAAEFLDEIPEILDKHDIEPTLFEFLYMPKDKILMSASYDMPGYAVTLAFQDIESTERQKRAVAAMKEVSAVCHDPYGGRIHLTKNVYAEPSVIEAMYDPRASEFLALKAQYDPDDVLRNCFFERLFPNAAGSTAACPAGPEEP